MIETVDIDFAFANRRYGPFDVQQDDDLYYRFEGTEWSAEAEATLNIAFGLTLEDDPHESAALTLDGTAGRIDIEGKAFVYLIVGTAEAGMKGIVHLYTRKRAVQTA